MQMESWIELGTSIVFSNHSQQMGGHKHWLSQLIYSHARSCTFMPVHTDFFKKQYSKNSVQWEDNHAFSLDAGSQREPDTNSCDIEHTRTKHYGISIFRYRRRWFASLVYSANILSSTTKTESGLKSMTTTYPPSLSFSQVPLMLRINWPGCWFKLDL